MQVDPDELAAKYLAAVEQFCDTLSRAQVDRLDYRPDVQSWSARDIAFHVAEMDQLLGVRLRRVISEDNPRMPSSDLEAWARALRPAHLDVGLAVDALRATSALNLLVIEKLTPAQLERSGKRSEGHEIKAVDIAAYFAIHIETHVKQLNRILGRATSR